MKLEHSSDSSGNRHRTVSRLVFVGFILIAAYFLFTEHRAHLIGILPFLLLAACPLLHLFHHRGHKHGDSGASGQPPGGGPGTHGH